MGWQAAKSLKTSQLITSTKNDLTKAQGELLKSFGCECTSPRVNLTTTDSNILKKSEANQLGQYRFQVNFLIITAFTLHNLSRVFLMTKLII